MRVLPTRTRSRGSRRATDSANAGNEIVFLVELLLLSEGEPPPHLFYFDLKKPFFYFRAKDLLFLRDYGMIKKFMEGMCFER